MKVMTAFLIILLALNYAKFYRALLLTLCPKSFIINNHGCLSASPADGLFDGSIVNNLFIKSFA